MGERRRPVLDSRRERALDSSLGVRGRRDESVVTGVPRKPGTGYAVRVYVRFLAMRVSAVASAIGACRPRRRLSVGVGERRSPVLDLLRELALVEEAPECGASRASGFP